MNKKTKVSAFYDSFFSSRMIRYRIEGNKRLDKAFLTIKKHLKPGSNVLDVGCGIGIIADKVAKFDSSLRVHGVDLSAKNIEYAKLTVRSKNATFSCADFVSDPVEAPGEEGEKYDVLLLVDVFEHFPEDSRAKIFARLAEISSPKAIVVLTYPSPEYQSFLQEFDPNELQVIDNTIRPLDLISESNSSGWRLIEFSYQHVWRKNQYVHAVLSKSVNLVEVKLGFKERILERLRSALMVFLKPVNQFRYVSIPLGKMKESEEKIIQ